MHSGVMLKTPAWKRVYLDHTCCELRVKALSFSLAKSWKGKESLWHLSLPQCCTNLGRLLKFCQLENAIRMLFLTAGYQSSPRAPAFLPGPGGWGEGQK